MAEEQKKGLEGVVVADTRLSRVQGLSLIHISEPTRPYSISYAVFCLKKKNKTQHRTNSLYSYSYTNDPNYL